MNWDSIPLGNVLQIRRDYVPVLDQVLYKYATLHPYPSGLSHKGHKRGTDFRTKQHKIIHAGQFVISRTRIQQRYWGIVPTELDGAIVHSTYLSFDIHPDLNTAYFAAYLATSLFHQSVLAARSKQGRLDVRRLARISIPFPPLEDQTQIAETWENAYKMLKHTSDMYASITELKLGVSNDLFQKINSSGPRKPLGQCAVIGDNFSADYPIYITTNGKLLHSAAGLENDAIGIMPDAELDHHFLKFYLEHQKHVWHSAAVTTSLHLMASLQALQIPLLTLYEQRKIMAVFQQYDDVLQKLKVEHSELEHMVQGLMQQIFSGTLPLLEAISLLRTL